jgi:hypothetical protein
MEHQTLENTDWRKSAPLRGTTKEIVNAPLMSGKTVEREASQMAAIVVEKTLAVIESVPPTNTGEVLTVDAAQGKDHLADGGRMVREI